MAKHIFVRPARVGEAQDFIDWSFGNSGNGFDPAVVKFPTTFVLAAFDKHGVVAYLPVQQPLFLDALGPRPGADASDVAMALKELVQEAITQAYIKGSGEIYFLGTSELTNAFAEKQIEFKEVPYKLYRIKLADLEHPSAE